MENQEKVWDELAWRWNNFRNKPDEIVNYFKDKYTNNAGRIADLGCGNCRNLIPFKNFICYGIDFSEKMLNEAKSLCIKNNLDVKLHKAELTNLPLKDDFFDYALMLTSFHHLETKEKRAKALNELYRILRKDGTALITVWNKWQLKFLFRKKNSYVEWKSKDKMRYRYYYLFNYFELKNLLKKCNFKIIEGKTFKGNLIFIVKK